MQNYKYTIVALTWFKQIRYFFTPTSKRYLFFLIKRNKKLFAKHYFVSSTILSSEFSSFHRIKKPAIYSFVFLKLHLSNNYSEKKSKDCTAQSVAKTNLKLKGINVVKDIQRLR